MYFGWCIISPVLIDTNHSFKWQNALSHQIIVYQSFYGMLLTLLSYFLLQGKVLCFSSRIGKSVTNCHSQHQVTSAASRLLQSEYPNEASFGLFFF